MNQHQDQPQDSQNQPQDQPQDQQQEQPLEQPVATGLTDALSLHLPPFWPADPALWFAQVEDITIEKTKYEYVVASLSSKHASEVRDIILHRTTTPPAAVPNGRTWGSNAIPILLPYAATPQ